ncbi:MAG: hypothetical protein IJ087_17985 [Eggerthellaceae bacterium]|nr:hypothetical protein [Eggerthellaceae bacterium]
MARYYGLVGFYGGDVETTPGVWDEQIVERPYYGDVVRYTRSLRTGDDVNDDISVSNQISIVSDPYALQNFHAIRYVTWMNSKWKVSSVEVQFPRLILTIGEVYHGN